MFCLGLFLGHNNWVNHSFQRPITCGCLALTLSVIVNVIDNGKGEKNYAKNASFVQPFEYFFSKNIDKNTIKIFD